MVDNATTINIFVGGSGSVSNLVPFYVPLGIVSQSGRVETDDRGECEVHRHRGIHLMLLHQWYQSPVVFWPGGGEVVPGAPVNIDAPTISGAWVEGSELLCDEEFWTGTEPITYEYQWYQVEGEVVEPPSPPVAGSPVPSVSGSTSRGSSLHCSTGTWSGYPTPTYSYQWTRLP